VVLICSQPSFGARVSFKEFDQVFSDSEFRRLAIVRDFVSDVLSFEENYLLVLRSFVELEKNVNGHALNDLYFRELGFDRRQDIFIKQDLMVLAFLAAFVSYKDRFPQFHGHTMPGSTASRVKVLWEDAKLECAEFCACVHLRHFSVHRRSPIHSVSSGGIWNEDRSYHAFYTRFSVSIEALRKHVQDRKEKADFCDILAQRYTDQVDFFSLFKKALSRLGVIHNSLRELLRKEFDESEHFYICMSSRVSNLYPGATSWQAIKTEDGEPVEQVEMFSALFERTKRLMKRRALENVEQHVLDLRPNS
tara:strand:- start:571 stop:1488 length:918 start_codon:yes stop_codon:yes gene_type:complete